MVGQTVLTAAHVVAGAQKVRIRDPTKVMHEATVDKRFVGDAAGPCPDLALVMLDSSDFDVAAIPLARVDRDSPDLEPVERCHAVGYPWFAEGPSPEAVRDTVDACGYMPVGSKLASGLLSLYVSGPPRPLPESAPLSESEWSGMSGAPVVAAGCLLGVVTEHAPREGPSAITVTPLTALEYDSAHKRWGPGVDDPAIWWAQLGVAGLTALRPLPRRRVRPEPAYRATLRAIQARTRELRGRERERGEIIEFATSAEGYRWLVGGAWSGKTALLAAAVAALPEEVDAVTYFLSRREADADSNRFLSAVIWQLSDLLDEDPRGTDRHEFRSLWERACSAAIAAERHLLLVVDGLDEDLRPRGSPSVAALLPTIAGGSAHVLVSSRLYPELPPDVPLGHPMLSIAQTQLEPFDRAAELAALGRQEIDELKRRGDDGFETDVLAVLTAAAGPLAIGDLAALTTDMRPVAPAHTRRVRRLVTEDAARSLEPVGPPTTRRYQFAHASLLEYAQTDPDLADPDYRQRIHRWAEEWAAAGWTTVTGSGTATPRYLLEAYPATLAADSKHQAAPEDLERLADLVADIGWIDSAIALVGVDAVLAALRTASQLNLGHPRLVSLLRVLHQQAHLLRHPSGMGHIGYSVTALSWGALALGGHDEVAGGAADRLRRLPAPQFIPVWTTERISPNLMSVLCSKGDGVTVVAAGKGQLVSGDVEGEVRLWDPSVPGDAGLVLGRHDRQVLAVTVTSEGLVASTAVGGTVQVWDPRAPGDSRLELVPDDRWVLALAATGEGHVACGDTEGAVRLWDPSVPGDPGRELGRHDGQALAVAVTGDGLVVSGGDDGAVWLWDPSVPGDPGRELGRHDGEVGAVAVTADGLIVSGGSDGVVRVWDPGAPGDHRLELVRDDWWVTALATTGEGQVVSGDTEGAVRLWDPSVPGGPGRELGSHDDHSEVGAVVVTGDGLVVSGGMDGTLRLWDPHASGDPGRERGRQDMWVTALTVTGDGLVVSGDSEGELWLWDPHSTGHPVRELGCVEGGVTAVAVTDDGQVVSGGYQGAVRMWDPRNSGDPGRELGSHYWNEVLALAVTGDGLVVSGGREGAIRLWDPHSPGDHGRELGRQYLGSVQALAVTDDGLVVSGHLGGMLQLWDPRTPGDPGRELGQHEGGVWAVAVTGEGLVVSGGDDGMLRLWDPRTSGDPGCELGRHEGGVRAVTVTREGLMVSGDTEGTLRLSDPRRPGEPGRELARHDSPVLALAVADDEQLWVATYSGVTTFKIITANS